MLATSNLNKPNTQELGTTNEFSFNGGIICGAAKNNLPFKSINRVGHYNES